MSGALKTFVIYIIDTLSFVIVILARVGLRLTTLGRMPIRNVEVQRIDESAHCLQLIDRSRTATQSEPALFTLTQATGISANMKSLFSFGRKPEAAPEPAPFVQDDTPADIWGADVFRKTPHGAEVARQQGSAGIPQRLRTVLMLIDGRTPISSFSSLLVNYGDVSEIFRMMLEMGLIEKVSAGSHFERRATDRNPPDTMMANMSRAAAVQEQSLVQKIETMQRQQPQPSIAPTPQFRPAANPTAQPNNGDIRMVATEICTVLTDHLGLDGMDLSMAVERATDPAALLALQPALEEAMGKGSGAEGKRLIRNAYANLR